MDYGEAGRLYDVAISRAETVMWAIPLGLVTVILMIFVFHALDARGK